MHKTIKIVWRWQWLTSLNLKVLKFWSRDFRYCLCCISLRNVIKIWWHFTKIWRHNGYQADDRPPSCKLIFEVCKLSFSTFITLWFCVFLRESDNPWPNYGQNDIFYTVSDRHCKTKTSLFYYNSAANCLFFLKKNLMTQKSDSSHSRIQLQSLKIQNSGRPPSWKSLYRHIPISINCCRPYAVS